MADCGIDVLLPRESWRNDLSTALAFVTVLSARCSWFAFDWWRRELTCIGGSNGVSFYRGTESTLEDGTVGWREVQFKNAPTAADFHSILFPGTEQAIDLVVSLMLRTENWKYAYLLMLDDMGRVMGDDLSCVRYNLHEASDPFHLIKSAVSELANEYPWRQLLFSNSNHDPMTLGELPISSRLRTVEGRFRGDCLLSFDDLCEDAYVLTGGRGALRNQIVGHPMLSTFVF